MGWEQMGRDTATSPVSIPPAPDGTAAVPIPAAPDGGMAVPAPEQAAPTPSQPPEKQGPVRRFLGNLAEQVNPVTAVKGIAQLSAHPVDTYNADASARTGILEDAKQRFGKGDIPGGIAKGVEAFIPFLGPALSKAGDQFESGDIAGGAGSSVGMGLNMAGPAALAKSGIVARVPAGIRGAMQNTAERGYQTALRPSLRMGPEAAQATVQTGLREGIPVSKAGIEKLSGLVDDLNTQISDRIQAAGPKRQISPGRAVQNTRDLESQFQNQVNPTSDVAAIGASREDFLNQLRPQGVPGGAIRNMTAEEAQAMKQGTYAQLKSRAYGELGSATVEAQKSLARGLKEELAAQFPELDALNAREGTMLKLEPELERAVQRYANRHLVGIGTPIAGGAVGIMTGSRPLAALTGAVKAILSPPVVSRLAIALSRASNGSIPLATAQARMAGYANAIAQGESAGNEQLAASPASQ